MKKYFEIEIYSKHEREKKIKYVFHKKYSFIVSHVFL